MFMEDPELYSLLELVGERVKRAFDIRENLPMIEFVEGIPDLTAFGYDLEGNVSLAIKPSLYRSARANNMQWGLSEEVAHFCHYVINKELFHEGIFESERKDRENNSRLLEIGNLKELVGRVGGFYGGLAPPDYERTLDAFGDLMRRAGGRDREEFEINMKDPLIAQAVSHISNRVWGTALGDDIISRNSKAGLPFYELVRSLARVNHFREVGKIVEQHAPYSNIMWQLADSFLSR